ncbi:hypothetical protein D9613_009118 [Agrocybe pediades]|uniref:Lysine-specific metallo-endopeptidase domain-containing protein n=1 Tax=Agrocybe pediades TaxID=84607 RepID=A0A8H4R5G7_9AGAR|nr:hypothetical protein D9613_009118 [Agrocybe pediades]
MLPALAAIGVASATTTTAKLSLSLSGPTRAGSLEDLKIISTLTNVGEHTVLVLNDPRGPLSKAATNTFEINSETGPKPAFVGIRVKYSPNAAAAIHAYSIIKPGESINVEHDLSSAYNFANSGEGKYSIQAQNMFFVVDSSDSNKVDAVYATSSPLHIYISLDNAYTAELPRQNVTTSKEAGTLQPAAVFVGCTAVRRTAIESAYMAAQAYATGSYNAARNSHGTTPRFITWFGVFDTTRYNTVVRIFTAINGNRFSMFTYDCTCTDADTYAWVAPDKFGTINLCPLFWSAPNIGVDSKAGTIIHEASHFTANGGTDDWVYGTARSRELARTNPARAIDNADNYQYFTENPPA